MITEKIFLDVLLAILLIIFGIGIGLTAKDHYEILHYEELLYGKNKNDLNERKDNKNEN